MFEKNIKRVGPDYITRVDLKEMINNSIISSIISLFFDSFDYARKAFYLLYLNNPIGPQH